MAGPPGLEAAIETAEDVRMASMFRPVAVSALLMALAACATAPPSASVRTAAGGSSPSDDSSPFGLYLAGQAALDAGDTQAAADFFDRASAGEPDAGFLKERVFTAALMAGDVQRAAAIAPVAADGGASSLVALTQAVEDLAEGKGKEAYARLAQAGETGEGGGAIALLKPWAAAAAGRSADAVAMPPADDRLIRLVAGLDQGLLFEQQHRYAEAETAFKALLAQGVGGSLVAGAYGEFLERRGRRAEAVAVYDQVLAGSPDDADIKSARARAAAKAAAPPAPTLREGAAEALMVPAAAVLADKQEEAGLVFLRLVLRLDPKRDQAWLLAGDVMSTSGDVKAARMAFAEVGQKSPHYVDARNRLAWSYQTEDKEVALKIARETVQQEPGSSDAKLTLVDLLRADDRFEEAAKMMDPIIAAAGDHAQWRLYYMRGVALERAGQWTGAQQDLQKALQVQPDQPEVLNYLGYSWVNRGERVKEGLAMIQKAVAAQPEEGAYIDSLGWAYFRLGDYPKAVETLERAVTLDAGDAEINDHLGDAYWRAGRHDEARFQWRAVLTMKPDPDVKARAEAKLNSSMGLDVLARPPAVAS